MSEALVKDLAQYKNYKDKGVTTAARGLIGVFRIHNPALLERKDRVCFIKKQRKSFRDEILIYLNY